jgi:hypothetical protein
MGAHDQHRGFVSVGAVGSAVMAYGHCPCLIRLVALILRNLSLVLRWILECKSHKQPLRSLEESSSPWSFRCSSLL